MQNYKWLLMAVGAVIITGCGSVLKSTRVDPAVSGCCAPIPQGIPYFLPKGKIHILATRSPNPISEPSEDGWSKQQVEITRRYTNAVTGDSNAYVSNYFSAYEWRTNGLRNAVEQRYEYTVAINEVIEPDPEAMFMLKADESGFANDSYHIRVQGGLIQSINSTNSDQTGEIIKSVAELGVTVFKLASGLPIGGGGFKLMNVPNTVPEEVVPDYPPVLDLVFDPFNDKELDRARAELARARLQFDGLVGPASARADLPGALSEDGGKAAGVFFRPALPYQATVRSAPKPLPAKTATNMINFHFKRSNQHILVESNALAAAGKITEAVNMASARLQKLNADKTELYKLAEEGGDKDDAKKEEPKKEEPKKEEPKKEEPKKEEAASTGQLAGVLQRTVFLPNHAPVMSYDIRRAALVSKTTKLAFSNGSLVDVSVDKPSQVLAGVKVPLEIAKSVVALPTDLIQLKINIANSNNSLLAAQTAQLTALSNQLVAERALEQLRRATNAATTPATNTPAAP